MNGAIVPGFEDDEKDQDPDELLSDEDAPDLQDEIAKTLTSLRVCLRPHLIADHATQVVFHIAN
jgi:hypothetical protein